MLVTHILSLPLPDNGVRWGVIKLHKQDSFGLKKRDAKLVASLWVLMKMQKYKACQNLAPFGGYEEFFRRLIKSIIELDLSA